MTGTGETDERPGRGQGWLVAAVCTGAMTVSYVDRQVLAALGPTVREKLHFDATHFGWLTSAFALAYLSFAPLSGAVVDRIGPRRGLIAAVLVWSLVAGLQGAATTFGMLFFVRVLLGAAESPSFPSAARTVRNVLGVRDRSAGLGLLFTGSSIGAMIAGPLSIWLKVHFGWRAAFGIAGALGTAWIPIFWLVTRDPSTRRAMARSQATRPGPTAVSPFRGPARPPAPETAPEPTAGSRWRLLLDPAVVRGVILVVGSAPAIMLVINWFPQMLELTFHVPQDLQSRYVWAPPAAFDIGAVGFGWLASRRDRKASTSIGEKRDLVALGAALAATLALVPMVSGPLHATLLLCVAMAGGGSLYTLLTAEMLARVDAKHTAMAGGITAAAQSITHIVAGPLVGKSVDHWHDYSHALVCLGLWTLPFAAAWILSSAAREPRTHAYR